MWSTRGFNRRIVPLTLPTTPSFQLGLYVGFITRYVMILSFCTGAIRQKQGPVHQLVFTTFANHNRDDKTELEMHEVLTATDCT